MDNHAPSLAFRTTAYRSPVLSLRYISPPLCSSRNISSCAHSVLIEHWSDIIQKVPDKHSDVYKSAQTMLTLTHVLGAAVTVAAVRTLICPMVASLSTAMVVHKYTLRSI